MSTDLRQDRWGSRRLSIFEKDKSIARYNATGFWPKLKEFFNPPDTPAIPAVCIPPGARLLVRDIPAELQRECGFQKDVEEAAFTQITAAR